MSRPNPRHWRRTQGQVVPIVAGILMLVAVLGLGLAHVGERALAHAQAQNAADAAALAAAQDQSGSARQVAQRLAVANDAQLVTLEHFGSTVVVTVRHNHVQARAAARLVGFAPPGK